MGMHFSHIKVRAGKAALLGQVIKHLDSFYLAGRLSGGCFLCQPSWSAPAPTFQGGGWKEVDRDEGLPL